MLRIVWKKRALDFQQSGPRIRGDLQIGPYRLAVRKRLEAKQFYLKLPSIGNQTEAGLYKLGDCIPLRFRYARVEQGFGRREVQIVREVDDVGDKGAFDLFSVEANIEVAERYRMGLYARSEAWDQAPGDQNQ
jgi:hypothetical protein